MEIQGEKGDEDENKDRDDEKMTGVERQEGQGGGGYGIIGIRRRKNWRTTMRIRGERSGRR